MDTRALLAGLLVLVVDYLPIPAVKRILAVLDEEVLIGIERRGPDKEPERELAPAPELTAA